MNKWITASVFFILTACNGFSPYIDTRREAGVIGQIGQSTPDMISICYNASTTTSEDVMELARAACSETDRVPVFQRQENFACPVMVPTRIFFACQQKKSDK